jgi:hypothetical protein
MIPVINLFGPSTVPGAPELTPSAINAAVNAALAALSAQLTVAATTGTTAIAPAAANSVVVAMSANTTLTIGTGYAGQMLRVEIKQDATGSRIVTLGTGIVFGTDLPSYTASTAANARDLLQFINSGGTTWMLAAVSHGFGV